MAYKYGRRAPKNAPALSFARMMSSGIPAHPREEDYLAKFSSWSMLGNDVAGDCNAVTWANTRRLVTGTLATEYYPTQDQVWEFYKTQNPNFNPTGTAQTDGPGSNADGGMDIQTGLEYLHKNGGPDGAKVVAFAKVDHNNVNEVKAALAIFGALWVGILVLNANQQEFSEGKPWTDVKNSGVDGGHAILVGGYDPRIRFITWAQETSFASSFWHGSVQGQSLVEETWVAIWPEHLGTTEFQQGVDLRQLQADYQALTGSQLVLP